MSRLRRAMHLAHQYQVLIAIIVASLIFTAAWFMRNSPVVDPRVQQVAARGSTPIGAVGRGLADGVTPDIR